MKHLTFGRILLVLVGTMAATAGQLSAQSIQTTTADLVDWITSTVSNLPGAGTDLFVPATANDRTEFRNTVDLFLAEDLEGAQTIASRIDYEVLRFEDTGDGDEELFALLPTSGNVANQGFFFLRPSNRVVRNLVIEAPHPLLDSHSATVAGELFRQSKARAFFFAGAHRCANTAKSACVGPTTVCSGSFRVSDVSHTTDSYFQVFQEAIAFETANSLAVQIHGFGNRPDEFYFSDGTATDTSNTGYLSNALAQELNRRVSQAYNDAGLPAPSRSGMSCNRPLDTDQLCATHNTQGRFLNSSADPCLTAGDAPSRSGDPAHFLSLELSNEMRTPPTTTDRREPQLIFDAILTVLPPPLLVLLDRSGSMLTKLATGETRCEAAEKRAATEIGTYNGMVALWTFAGDDVTRQTSGFVTPAEAQAALSRLEPCQPQDLTPLAGAICDSADFLAEEFTQLDAGALELLIISDGAENNTDSSHKCFGEASISNKPPFSPGSFQNKVLATVQGRVTAHTMLWTESVSPLLRSAAIDVETGAVKSTAVKSLSDQEFFAELSRSTGGNHQVIADDAPQPGPILCGDAEISLAPAASGPTVGQVQCLTATVADPDGERRAGLLVRFEATGIHSAADSAFTGPQGTTRFCYSEATPGSDTVSATACSHTAAATVDWKGLADLHLVASSSCHEVRPGDTPSYTFKVTNDGPHVAHGVTLTSALPAQVRWLSDTCGEGPPAAGLLTWEAGALAVGASAECEVRVKVDAVPGAALDVVASASVRGEELDPDSSDNEAAAAFTIYPHALAAVATTGDVFVGPRAVVDSFDSCQCAGDARLQGDLQAGGTIVVARAADVRGELFAATPTDPTPLTAPAGLVSGGDLLVRAGKTLTLAAGDHLFDDVHLSSNSRLRGTGGPVRIWFKGSLQIDSNASAEPEDQIPDSLTFLSQPDSGPVVLSSRSRVIGQVFAPNVDITISSNAELFGSVTGFAVELAANARVHTDVALCCSPGMPIEGCPGRLGKVAASPR